MTNDGEPVTWPGVRPVPPPADPVQTTDERVGVNGKIGLVITRAVGTMWTAYVFAAVALVSLPAAIASGDRVVLVGWIAQTFLQLVLLPIILVGQNVQARAADKRSRQSYSDTGAILRQVERIEARLGAHERLLRALASSRPEGGDGRVTDAPAVPPATP